MSLTLHEQNAILGSPAALKLAKLHWYRSSPMGLMNSQGIRTVAVPSRTELRVCTCERTAFGDDVGHGWESIGELTGKKTILQFRTYTEQALAAAQTVKEAAFRLKDIEPHSYPRIFAPYTYPVRSGAGITSGDESRQRSTKIHHDRYDFLEELKQFVPDNQRKVLVEPYGNKAGATTQPLAA
jgi:hypothetical protein